jgi:tetratricopeptide (TPR) repeat protein
MSRAALRSRLAGTATENGAMDRDDSLALAEQGAPAALPLLSRGLGTALIGAVLLVGAGIITAIVLTRTPSSEPNTVPVHVERPTPATAVPDPGDKVRDEREKHRPEYVRLMIEAGIAANARRYEDAIRAYDAALKRFPDDAEAQRGLREARVGLAALSRQKGDADRRRAGFVRFMEQGKEAMTAKQYAGAVRAFQQAVQLQPDDEAAARALTEAQTALAAEETHQQKLAEYHSHMNAGQAAAVAGSYADALREYLAALRLMPGDPAALEGQRLAERRLAAIQDDNKRKAEFARLVDQAGASLRNQRFQDAIDNYTAALKLFKDDPAARRGLAEAQQGLNNLNAEVTRHVALGTAAMRSARFADAILAFREALRLAPTSAVAAKGLQDAQTALAAAQTTQAAYLQFMAQGAAALRTLRFADAIQAYTAALQVMPNDPDALQGLANARAGIAVIPNPGLLLPNAADFQRELQRGLADLCQQHFRDAIRHFKRALELQPDSVQAARGLRQARYGDAMADGQAALTARRYAAAVRSFEEALAQAPGDPAATTALRQARKLQRG